MGKGIVTVIVGEKPITAGMVLPLIGLVTLRNSTEDEKARSSIEAVISRVVGKLESRSIGIGIQLCDFPLVPILEEGLDG